MTWAEIGKNHLLAAKQAQKEFPRSSVSRAYYAARVVLTQALIDGGWVPVANRETAPHHLQPRLIGQYLAQRGQRFVRELRALIRRLYDRRLDADYRRTVTVGKSAALDSIREGSAVFVMPGVR